MSERERLDEWRARYGNPFGRRYERTHIASEVVNGFKALEGEGVALAGRIRTIRRHGKATFADLEDASGRIQLLCRLNVLGDERYELFAQLDLGDIIGAKGGVMRTRRGEISIEVHEFELLSKSLRALPEKWHGLKDVETRYRQRYLDLLVNPDVRRVFETRSKVLQSIRAFFAEQGFLEVETPMLNVIAGGANARPFVTHHHVLDMDLYMRIAPELYLKRLLVGGFERVYEIGKNFRNEGISTRHNPEYTSVEAYLAYADYHDVMDLTEALFARVVRDGTGGTQVEYQGSFIDFQPPWPRIPMLEAVRETVGLDLTDLQGDDAAAGARAAEKGVHVPAGASWGRVVAEAFETLVEERLQQPTFIIDYPVAVSPLAKRKEDNPALTDRFELYIAGVELVNGFSELNDPVDQRERFERQLQDRERGDAEAHMMDEDFVRALEHGMPPAGGLGIGVDRLMMLLTDSSSIRDVILFPHMRPRAD